MMTPADLAAVTEVYRLQPGEHPHPDKRHVMRQYRGYILGSKRKHGTARGQAHYMDLIRVYLAAKSAIKER